MVFNVELVPKHHHADVKDEERRNRLIAEQRLAINHIAPSRRLFYTKDGYMGLGPPDTREGDLVRILRGYDVPVLLRSDEEYYHLVGRLMFVGS